jgi:hypothetical protein
MAKIKLARLVAGALAVWLVGCSEQPAAAPQKKAEEQPEPLTGQSALYRMYQVARSWAPDCQVLKLDSMRVSDVPDQPGKAGAWEATFVSAARGTSRAYTWSAVESVENNLHKGVFQTSEQPYAAHGSGKPFVIAAVKTDSDAALATAKTKAVDYEKKNPRQPVIFLLEETDRFPDPAWRVIWGESVGTSSFSVFVDAMSGGYLSIMH